MSVVEPTVVSRRMRKDKTKAYCSRCRHEQVFVRATMHHGLHLLFSILTLGLWAVSWLAIYIGQRLRPWRCEHCNWTKPEFREAGKAPADAEKPGRMVDTE